MMFFLVVKVSFLLILIRKFWKKVGLEIRFDTKKILKKITYIIMLYGLIIVILFYFYQLKSFQIPGYSLPEETFLIVSNFKNISIIAFNVMTALAICFLMRIMRNSLELFRKSPFERLSVFLCYEITKILATNVLKSFASRKK